MKLSDIKGRLLCNNCGNPLFSNTKLEYARVTIKREFWDHGAIMRAHGMECLMGGNVPLARLMGIDEEISKPLQTHERYLCSDCLYSIDTTIAQLIDSDKQ